MNFLKRNKVKMLSTFAVILALIAAFNMTGKTPTLENGEKIQQTEQTVAEVKEEPAIEEQKTEEDIPQKPQEYEKEAQAEEKKELYCTLSVRCDTLANDISRLDEEKRGLVGNGVIFPQTQVEFNGGESVFDVLLREMKENKIHLEFVNTPVYKSVYIEGIGNIYEFDAGELSGWMYKVNGEFPNFGCSRYILKNGDRIEFVYTCDLGKDVGNSYTSNNGG